MERKPGEWDLDLSSHPRMGDSEAPLETAAEVFQALAQDWKAQTGHLSLMERIVAQPSYRRIISEGNARPDLWLTMILQELEQRPAPWYEALKAISGESPVAPTEMGRPALTRAAWLRWGREKGLLPA